MISILFHIPNNKSADQTAQVPSLHCAFFPLALYFIFCVHCSAREHTLAIGNAVLFQKCVHDCHLPSVMTVYHDFVGLYWWRRGCYCRCVGWTFSALTLQDTRWQRSSSTERSKQWACLRSNIIHGICGLLRNKLLEWADETRNNKMHRTVLF